MINENPLTKLSGTYQSKLLSKIQENFTKEQQQLFVGSLYAFLNHHQTNDYVISLDDVWKFIGFNRINDAKRLLVKYFKENSDYKIEKAALQLGKAGHNDRNLGGAGLNKETILMNVVTFKKLCLRARTMPLLVFSLVVSNIVITISYFIFFNFIDYI